MRNVIKTLSLVTCLVAANAFAAGSDQSASSVEEFRSKLRTVEQKARQVSNLVKSKMATPDSVREEAEALSASVKELRVFMNENGDALRISDPQRRFTVETTAEVMEIMIDNKLRLINEGDFRKNRGIIRAKADGIVQRVKLVEKNLG